MERDADVVVVGAGIVGCATAYFLARRGARVVVVERGPVPGEQSRKNWGFVRQQGRDPLEMPLVVEANRLWQGLERELDADIEWVRGGNLALAADDARLARFEAWLPLAREFGLDTRLLRARDLDAVVPGLAGGWVGGMHTPGDGHADPEKTTDAFARAAVAHGATLHLDCAVQAVTTRAGAVAGVVTEHGEIRAPAVVCAAGAWSSRLARTLGLDLPQRWVRGTVARTTPAPAVTACAVWGPGVAFRQRRDGSFNIAAGGALDHDVTLDSAPPAPLLPAELLEEQGRCSAFTSAGRCWRSLAAALPGSAARRRPLVWDRGREPDPERRQGAARASPSSSGCCRRCRGSASRDELGRLHRRHARPRARARRGAASSAASCSPPASAATASRWGPIAGRLVSELIVDGKPSLDIAGFRFSRFAEGAIGRPRNVL